MSVLRALLKQMVGGLEETPEEISQTFQDQKTVIGGREPGPSDIVKMLRTATSKKHTFICIDGLDECATEHRVKLLDSLHHVLQYSPSTRIFVTGRPQVGPEMVRHLAGSVASIFITPRGGDIISYLRNKLGEDTTLDAMDSSLEADILKKIPEDISEIFLLVSLSIDAILRETTISRRRQKLSTLTDGLGLGDAYGATLGRIKQQGGGRSRLGMAALMWISHSERPLKTEELCHAVAVEIGSPNLDAGNIPSMGTLLACCQGLAVMDRKVARVRLIHFTVQEYLRAHPEFFGTAHATMAEICLSYLNSQQVKAISASPSPNLEDTPLLEYSSLYWGVHAKRDLSGCAKTLALKLFDDNNNDVILPSKILLKAHRLHGYDISFDKVSEFSGLHCASFFGIVDLVASLVEVDGCDINQNDCVGNTPLVWAAQNGHEGVVNILLGRGNVHPEKPDKYGRTPLSWAAWAGSEGMVKILLGRSDVDPDKPDFRGWTPLVRAVRNGHTGVVKMLLGRDDVNPDKPDNEGRTPLIHAVWKRHAGIMKMLLGRGDVNPDKPDNYGRTPLDWVATNGSEGAAEMLLRRRDVNPNGPVNCDRTPLICAILGRYEGVTKLLLERDDINPSRPDNEGITPLSWAAVMGDEGVVKILLGRDDIIPDQPDHEGCTPLWWAAYHGHEEVVKILLRREDVYPHKPDHLGKTPLSIAAANGNKGVVKILLGHNRAFPTNLVMKA